MKIILFVVQGADQIFWLLLWLRAHGDFVAAAYDLFVLRERTDRSWVQHTTPLISVTRPRLMLVLDLSLSPLFDSLPT